MRKTMSFTVGPYFGIAALGLAIAAFVSPALAVPIISHVGSNDPTTEGWTPDSIANGFVEGGTETTASGSHDYWRMVDFSTAHNSNPHYTADLSAANLSGDWTFEASVRVVGGPTVIQPYPAPIVSVYDNVSAWQLNMGDDFVCLVDNTGCAVTAPISFDDYHIFLYQFSHNGAGTVDDLLDIFIDGTLVFNNIGRSIVADAPGSLINSLYFGMSSSANIGDANYELVLFDDGTAPPPPVPEPSTILLLGTGILGLIGYRRRRSRRSG